MRFQHILLVSPWLLAACGNLSTQTLDLSTITPTNHTVPGLPFTLNKPQFTITHVAATDSAPESYQAVPNYVADPSQYFAAALHPPLTATIDWTFTWDENGSLSTSNAKVTDQSAATVASLVKLGVAAAALDVSKDTQAQVVGKLDGRIKVDLSITHVIFDESTKSLRGATSEELADLRADWARMKTELTALAAKGDLPQYAYSSEEDRLVLLTALHLNPLPFTPIQQSVRDATAANAALASQPGAEQPIPQASIEDAATAIQNAYGSFDLAKLQSIQSTAVKLRSQRQAVMTLQNAPAVAFTTDVSIRLQTYIAAWAQQAVNLLKTSPNDVLFSLVNIDPGQWEARVVAELNRQINARLAIDRANAYATRGGGNFEASDPELADLNRRKAAVLGLTPVYDQVVALQRVSTANPAAFKAAQDALAPLLKQLADAEAALSAPKPAPKSEAPFVADALQAPANVTVDPTWIDGHVKGRPTYVVVMQPVVGAPVVNGPAAPGSPAAAHQDPLPPPLAAQPN